MKIMKTWACSLSLLSFIVGGMSAIPAPIRAQATNTSVKIKLTGAPIAGIRPEGSSEFRMRGTRASFRAEAERVNLPDGTVLAVKLNGNAVGAIMLALGKGKLQIEGSGAPIVHKGDVVTVTNGSNIVLQGAF